MKIKAMCACSRNFTDTDCQQPAVCGHGCHTANTSDANMKINGCDYCQEMHHSAEKLSPVPEAEHW